MNAQAPNRGSWRLYDEPDLPAPLAAALSAFVEHGYHGTTVRGIAARANLSVPGLYHHYPSKQALLIGLTDAVMNELLTRTRQADREAGDSPLDRFDAVVESLLLFHMHRREQAFIGSTEIRSMEPLARHNFVALRDQQQEMLDAIVRQGVQDGVFGTPHPDDASRAVVTMCVAVSGWYRPDGPLSVRELVDRYRSIARNMVGVPARR